MSQGEPGVPGAPSRPAAPTTPAVLRRILLNAGSLVGAYAFPRLFTFASVVLAARILGPAEFGAYGTAVAFAVILSVVSTLGMMPLLVRDLARSPDRAGELLGAAHLVKAGSGALMLLVLVLLAHVVLAYPAPVVAAAFLLGLGYAVGSFAENLGAWFQAVERMGTWMQANALFGVVSGVSGALLVWLSGSVVWFCAAPLLGQIVALGWLHHRAPPEARRPRRAAATDVRRLTSALLPFAGAFVALTVFYKIDVLLLTRWRAPEEVGTYVAAYKFVDVAHALTLATVAAVYPRLSRQAPRAEPGGRWAATRVSELLVLAMVPAAALVWLLRAELVAVLFGAGYAHSAGALGWLAAALPPLALNLFAGYVLAARGRMGLVASGYVGGCALKLALLALLVPPLGAGGAALAMFLSESCLALGFLTALRLAAGAAPDRRTLSVACGAVGGAGAALLLPGPTIVGAAAYVVVVTALYRWSGALPLREWALLRRALLPEGRASQGTPARAGEGGSG